MKVPMDAHDRLLVKKEVKRRWIETLESLVFPFLLPIACVALPLRVWNGFIFLVNTMSPTQFSYFHFNSWADVPFFIFGIMTAAGVIYFAFALGNVILFIKNIPPIYIDLIRGMKKEKSFYPRKYALTEFNQYFIKPEVEPFLFLKVSADTYNQIDESRELILAYTPLTEVFLSVKTPDGTGTINIEGVSK